MIKTIFEILKPLYTSPWLWGACGVCATLPVWILVFYAGMTRIQKAQTENDADHARAQTLLVVFSPILLILAILLAVLTFFMPVILVLVVIGLLPFLLILFGISLAIEYYPDVKDWILASLGKFGEKILKFIENSPNMPFLRWEEIRSWLATRAEIHYSRHPQARDLSPRSTSLPFDLLGLQRASILLTGAANTEVKLAHRQKAIQRLVRMKEYDRLLNLARERSADVEVRFCAAQALEGIDDNQHAVQAWLSLGHTAPQPLRRLDAAHCLARLGQKDPARSVLKRLLSQGDLPGKFQIEAVKTEGLLGETAQAVQTLTELLANRREADLRLRAAEALCALGSNQEALPALQAMTQDYLASPSRRQAAVHVLSKYRQAPVLIKLADHPQVDHSLRCRILRSLEKLGETAFCATSWRHMAEDGTIPFEQRVRAASAYSRLEKPDLARSLLRELGRNAQAQGAPGLQIATELARLGYEEDARLALDQLINAPGSPDVLKKEAIRTLNGLNAGKFSTI
ncbi:MAG TPA: HEAT repeat domain-containing protein [Anaerolineales bacterium]|nr:HEAT repeat domain-containing protein [Anaerolineales bacterium]